jgi:hypothetical protein
MIMKSLSPFLSAFTRWRKRQNGATPITVKVGALFTARLHRLLPSRVALGALLPRPPVELLCFLFSAVADIRVDPARAVVVRARRLALALCLGVALLGRRAFLARQRGFLLRFGLCAVGASCTLICFGPRGLGLKRPRPRLVALLAGGFATAFQPSPAGDPCDENDDR